MMRICPVATGFRDNYKTFEVPYYGTDNDDYVNGSGFCCDDAKRLKSFDPSQNDNPELFQYYYHSDHLGSSSLITNLDGEVVQHVEYIAFGEIFLEERNNTWNTPYLFNAKEYDAETGLYYYGARYYDPRVSVWYGVDKQTEKYPNISAYTYCTNNPIKFIDPDGEKIVLAGSAAEQATMLSELQKITNDKLGVKADGTVYIVKIGGENSSKYLKAGSELIRDLNKKDSGSKTVTISYSTRTTVGNYETDVNSTDAINGKGTDTNVYYDPRSTGTLIPVKDPTTGNVSDDSRPLEIGLGHELIHAHRSMKGKAVDYGVTESFTYKDASGNSVTDTGIPTEELESVGLKGNYNVTENKIRKEQGLKERGAY